MNLIDLLHTDGYSAVSLAEQGGFPFALVRDGQPVGFLQDDLSVDMVTNHANLAPEVKSMVEYMIQNQSKEIFRDSELLLSSYEGISLVTGYDHYNHKPYYAVYQGKDTILSNTQNLDIAKREFLTRSGLQTVPAQPVQKYQRRMTPEMPPIMQQLRQLLNAIGLKLRMMFGLENVEYHIQHGAATVAAVNEQLHVTYTDRCSSDLKQKIDAVVQKIREEQAIKQPEVRLQKEQPVQAPAEIKTPQEKSNVQEKPDSEQTVSKQNTAVGEQPVQKEPQKPAAPLDLASLSPQQQKIYTEFLQQYTIMQSAKGFNGEIVHKTASNLEAQFGTSNLAVFEQKLVQGEYTEKPNQSVSFEDRLQQANQEAARRNQQRSSQNSDKNRNTPGRGQ